MTLRTRLWVIVSVSLAACIIAATSTLYLLERGQVRRQVDGELTLRAERIAAQLQTTGNPDAAIRGGFGEPVAYAQVVSAAGEVVPLAPGTPPLPIDERAIAVAAGTTGRFLTSVMVENVDLRILTLPLEPGRALQVARVIEEFDLHLLRMSTLLVAVAVSGIGVSVLLGNLISRASLAPLERLIATADRVAKTADPSHRIEIGGRGELERLTAAFNRMLESLELSADAQRQLVADASHELQTPLTSLRTDIEVIARSDRLDPAQRARLANDLLEQIDEMSLTVTNLVDLAREARSERSTIDLAEAVADAVRWSSRMHPTASFTVAATPVSVVADPDAVRQLLRNLLDNAARWNANGHPVEVTVQPDFIVVRDHGPGIDPADLPHVFKRFYRGEAARGTRGAGLGLAIVERAAQVHGWRVEAFNHPQGGAVFRVDLHEGKTVDG